MSVGGTVVFVERLPDKVRVATTERQHPRDKPTATNVVRNADSEWIAPGDSLWWQGDKAYWTPATGERVDVEIPRVGFSYTWNAAADRPAEVER